ncbi:MAG: hypothetical protein LBU89_00595 [Fibromonadaceae bacterium]|jgi:hypothetical protein|nr:hypothetical protein [Fibromonadaceae bacterium]
MTPALKADKFCTGLCKFFLLLGIFSRIFIYASGTDLWLEEALLWEKFKPLIGSFNISEYALRLFPLLTGIATLCLAYAFALREFDIRFSCIFLFLLVSSDPLLFYSVNFSLYGMEAFLIVLCLCVWSFSERKTAMLILLISLSTIFCIICNYNPNESGTVKNYYIQILGRHFINFHYIVFGAFVWINAVLFFLPFGIGSVFLYKEKRTLFIAVFSAIFILLLFHALKIAPLGMPYNDFMRLMRNWAQMQITGSKYIVFILPLVFIPVAFCIHKVFLRLGTATLISVLCVFAFLALSSNSVRIHKGIGSPKSYEILMQINENANTKSLLYVDSASRPIFEYYFNKTFKDNPNFNYFTVQNNGYMYLNNEIFLGKYHGKIEELFDVMENFETENAFFFFTFNNFSAIRQSNELIEYIQKNHTGKSQGFQSKLTGAAWVRL